MYIYLEAFSSFSNVYTTVVHLVCVCWSLSRVLLFATLCAESHQAPLSMEFSRQEFHSGLPFPSPGFVYLRELSNRNIFLKALGGTGSIFTHSSNMKNKYIINGITNIKIIYQWIMLLFQILLITLHILFN